MKGCVLFFGLLTIAFSAVAEDRVVVCPINGMIDDGVFVVVQRAVKEAVGAKALVFEIDTPGGLVDSAIKISQAVLSAPCRTIAYIKGMGAISAGALISFSCNDIVMSPDTNIGAATPVIPSAEGMLPTGEKEVSFMRAKMRALAERNNHNPAIAEAMVDKDIELRSYTDENGALRVFAIYAAGTGEAVSENKSFGPDKAFKIAKEIFDETPVPPSPSIPPPTPETNAQPPASRPASHERTPSPVPIDKTQLILPAGKLLTLTPKEALEYGVIKFTANSIDEALTHYDCAGVAIHRLTPTWAEILFRWLTSPLISGLLLMFGIGGVYIEMKTPGFGLPGIVGGVCLALFFGAHLVLGLAEWFDVLLVVTGVSLIIAEMFFIPGFGIAGAAGIICLIAGLYLSLTGVAIPQYSWDFDRLRSAGVSLGVATLSLTILIYILWRLFPRTPLYGRFVQLHVQQPEQGYVVQTEQEEAAVGLTGVAISMLRPAGRARFGETTYQVVSRGEYIPPGTPIVIVQVDGNRFVVERIEEKS